MENPDMKHRSYVKIAAVVLVFVVIATLIWLYWRMCCLTGQVMP